MPDATIRNATNHTLNIAFWVVAPQESGNGVGKTIKLNLAMFVHSVEVRVDHETNRFSGDDSWARASELGTSVFAGTAAVALGTGWVFGLFGHHASSVADAALGGTGVTGERPTRAGSALHRCRARLRASSWSLRACGSHGTRWRTRSASSLSQGRKWQQQMRDTCCGTTIRMG